MTDKPLSVASTLTGAIALIRAFVFNPRQTFRTLESTRSARWAIGVALTGLILVSVVLEMIFQSSDFFTQLQLTSMSFLVTFYVFTLTFFVLLRFLSSWDNGTFTTLALGVALAMLPLAFGAVPVLGVLAYLLTLALLVLLLRDHGSMSWLRVAAVMILTLVVLALVSILLVRFGIIAGPPETA